MSAGAPYQHLTPDSRSIAQRRAALWWLAQQASTWSNIRSHSGAKTLSYSTICDGVRGRKMHESPAEKRRGKACRQHGSNLRFSVHRVSLMIPSLDLTDRAFPLMA